MAFTNIWDNTQPADTELANLLGQNLRDFRTDIQQRMAAISGLDASKPNFAGDAQPLNWAGVLFFALDTAKLYQWSGSTWVDKTGSLGTSRMLIGAPQVYLASGQTAYYTIGGSGATLVNTSEAAAQIPMSMSGIFRSLYVTISSGQSASGTLTFTLRIGGVATAIQVTIPSGGIAGVYLDSSHTAPFSAGDLVSLQIVNSATVNSALVQYVNIGY